MDRKVETNLSHNIIDLVLPEYRTMIQHNSDHILNKNKLESSESMSHSCITYQVHSIRLMFSNHRFHDRHEQEKQQLPPCSEVSTEILSNHWISSILFDCQSCWIHIEKQWQWWSFELRVLLWLYYMDLIDIPHRNTRVQLHSNPIWIYTSPVKNMEYSVGGENDWLCYQLRTFLARNRWPRQQWRAIGILTLKTNSWVSLSLQI